MIETNFEKMLNEELQTLIKRLIFYLVNDSFITDDLYQNTIIKAWNKMSTLKDVEKFKPWILTIARNVVKDYFRQHRKIDAVTIDDVTISRFSQKLENQTRLETKEMILEVFEELTKDDKDILSLFYFKELPLTKIKDCLNLPLGTVKSRLYYAKKHFKQIYELKFKKEEYNMLFPINLPEIKISKLDCDAFTVDYQELRWWFMKPIEGYQCKWASYDYPERRITSLTKMESLGKVSIHGIESIEFSSIDYNFDQEKWDRNEYIMYARLTDTHVQWVGQFYFESNGNKKFRSFLDEDFAKDMGNIDPVKGDERIIKDEGKYRISEKGVITNYKNRSSGFGFFKVQIGKKSFECIRILEPSIEEKILVETYISRTGNTVLFRRYNAIDWNLNSGWTDKPWDEALPNNLKIKVDGMTYVHWYDCITDYVL